MTRRGRLRIAWLENMRFALGAMRAQKLRSFLTLLGVMAGVATVIMMVSFVVGFNNQVTASFTTFGTQLVQFQKFEPRFGGPDRPESERNRRDLTYEDALALKRLSRYVGAVSAERYLFEDTVVKAGRNQANSPVVFGGIGVKRLPKPGARTPSDLNQTSSYPVPAPDIIYFPKGFVTPLEVKVDGNHFELDVPLGKPGLYEISIWGKFPGSGQNELRMASLRTVIVE